MDTEKIIRTYSGAVAIVTGGASGIGRAISSELVKRGCEVIIADRQFGLAEETAVQLRHSGGKATAVEVDVTDYSAVEQLVQDISRRTGRIDYMFNNAGIGIGGQVEHLGIDDWNYIVNVNLNGVINGIQAVYRVMIAQGFGHIVNTASMAGLMPYPGGVAYGATKHAVVGLSKSLRAEAVRFDVRVSVLCPGVIRTSIWEGGGRFGRMLVDIPPEALHHMVESLKPMSPGVLAIKALNSIAKNKAVIVEPSWWKYIWWINRIFPSMGITISQKRFESDLKALSAGQAG
jgi:NAD(P)-dependent dehydrogenase (short-subunit alcohol dehydrogenase family)